MRSILAALAVSFLPFTVPVAAQEADTSPPQATSILLARFAKFSVQFDF